MKFIDSLAKTQALVLLGLIGLACLGTIWFLKGDIDILDAKFFYLKSEIQILFHSLGEEGRLTYRQINLIDFVFISVYTLFFIGMYTAFFKEMAKVLLIIPILLSVADFTETSLIYFLLNEYPQSHSGLETLLMLTTPLKWVLALSTLLVVVNGYFVNLYMKKS